MSEASRNVSVAQTACGFLPGNVPTEPGRTRNGTCPNTAINSRPFLRLQPSTTTSSPCYATVVEGWILWATRSERRNDLNSSRTLHDGANSCFKSSVPRTDPRMGRLVGKRVTARATINITGTPDIVYTPSFGEIHSDLTAGTNVTRARPLRANQALCSPGVEVHGKGFSFS